MEQFDIPVCLFMFKRDKAVEIIKRIKQVAPKKIYLLSDAGRNDEEQILVENCRKQVENEIDWECEIIKHYAEENRGVYDNIAGGACWVLQQEKWAIFLEDDNLPEVTFFDFCKEMLQKYENDNRVLWICGTNYLGSYNSEYSYVFTRHMLPCGWASWSNKFEKFYNGDLSLCNDNFIQQNISNNYFNKTVFKQYRQCWMSEFDLINKGGKPKSWDYQMDFSIKANSLLGICPSNNQIKNIGVDEFSTHGGKSFNNVMTKRFCGMESYPIEFPLKHPPTILIDKEFEKKIAKVITYPISYRFKAFVRKILRVPNDIKLKKYLLSFFKKKNK